MEIHKLKKIDYIITTIYLLGSFIIFFIYTKGLLPQKTINPIFLFYYLGSAFLLYGMYYKRLRKLKVNLIWGGISLIQILVYMSTKGNIDFVNASGGTFLESLLHLPVMLVSFQILRLIFKIIYKEELIINSNREELGTIKENRELKWADILFSIIGMLMIVFGVHMLS